MTARLSCRFAIGAQARVRSSSRRPWQLFVAKDSGPAVRSMRRRSLRSSGWSRGRRHGWRHSA